MKKFFAFVMTLSAAVIIIYGVKYAMTPVTSQDLRYTVQENSIKTEGYIIRDEWLMKAPGSGTAYYYVSEGDRVAAGSMTAALFYGDIDPERLNELSVIEHKIKNAELSGRLLPITAIDSSSAENYIAKRENDIIDSASKNDILSVSGYKNEINSLRESGEIHYEDKTSSLEESRSAILNDIGVRKEDITADISGLFSTYTDGFENQLVPQDIEKYDVRYYRSLDKPIKLTKANARVGAGETMCKIVNNHIWFAMVRTDSDDMTGHSAGDKVKLRFAGAPDTVADGEIYCISEESDGDVVVTVRCSDYIEDAFSYRKADMDLIFDVYEGYKIPIQALHTEDDGRTKVIGMIGAVTYDCYCDVLHTNTKDEYAIIRSSDNSETKLSHMEKIRIGER